MFEMSRSSGNMSCLRQMDEPSENSFSTSYVNRMHQNTEDSATSTGNNRVSAQNFLYASFTEERPDTCLWDQPNKLSEEMVRCMKNIFISLADSSTASAKSRALKMNCPPFSPQSERSTSLSWVQSQLVDTENADELFAAKNGFDPYRVRGKLSWADIGIYGSAIEVSWMSVGKKQLEYAAGALRKFRYIFPTISWLLVEMLQIAEI